MNNERMDYVIVKTSYNWADEADFPSYVIVTEEQLQEIKLDIFNYFEDEGSGFEVYVGTNEEIYFGGYDDIFSRYSYQETKLPHDDAKTVIGYMGTEFGECSLLRIWQDVIERMEEDDDE